MPAKIATVQYSELEYRNLKDISGNIPSREGLANQLVKKVGNGEVS
jgi:hypothetical protein